MKKNVPIDATLLMVELFKLRANLRAYMESTMSKEQKDKFNEVYSQHLKEIISKFLEAHPNLLSDDKLREALSDS